MKKKIELEVLNFDTMEDFKKWKRFMEEKDNSQYVKNTAVKTTHNKEYIYYFCHRSFVPRTSNKGCNNSKNSGSIKTGFVCPLSIKVHVNNLKVNVQYCSTHIWHDMEIGKQRLFTEDRSIIAEKKDVHNIKRNYNITYSTKKHENNAVSVRLWVEEMKKKGNSNPVLYYKPQGSIDSTVPHFTVCIDGTHGLNGYNFQLYTIVIVDEYGNGYPVAFCFSNRSDTDTYKHYIQCIKNTIGTINSFIFMSDDEPAFYNAWCSVMGFTNKQLLCTWHILRNWVKNLNKINGNEKKNIVFKTLKSLMFEVHENPDTVDFGKYFETCYSTRVKKWAMFNRKHVGINTNMYLELLHKNIKYCYLEGKHCKRISQDMITKVNDYWLVISENDINIQYKIEKCQSFYGCALQCKEYQICVHSYKCSCMNNIIYLNLCKHIHIPAHNDNTIVPLSRDLVSDNGFIQTDTEKIDKKNCEIKNKMEIMCGIYNCSDLNEEDQDFIIKQCDKIISMLSRGSRFKKPINETSKRKIEPQTRFWAKQKVQNQQPALSFTEAKHIRQSLKNISKYTLNVNSTSAFLISCLIAINKNQKHIVVTTTKKF
ncbi:hypothetical protein AGLY_016414 [Aphis glycines]|uniref:MULE transposase domain-containing protein n=1 Tax=Aphis glycines TaxID=307491 RepID=A0A6G0SZS3_APHGL|nr:hypothetical protein AGLY_016414 [Aphis glycines]